MTLPIQLIDSGLIARLITKINIESAEHVTQKQDRGTEMFIQMVEDRATVEPVGGQGILNLIARLSLGAIAISLAFGAVMSGMICLWRS